MVACVFIDGEAGTTGLQIRRRLEGRRDLALTAIDPGCRKDPAARRDLLNQADVAILCLPDEAAREAVALIENPDVRVLDASSAHRIAAGWIYGFPEMAPGQREAIAGASRVTNPGCYPTGFIALVRPLIEGGLLPPTWPLTVNAVSGYSGGGRGMIGEFEDPSSPDHTTSAFRAYALGLGHKHVPEMRAQTGLTHAPVFCPSVGRYYKGMIVEVPLALHAIPGEPSIGDIQRALSDAYRNERFVSVASPEEAAATEIVDPESMNGGNGLRLYVFGSQALRQARLIAVLDNLGKGAAGAAVQNLNLMLGLEETSGLIVND